MRATLFIFVFFTSCFCKGQNVFYKTDRPIVAYLAMCEKFSINRLPYPSSTISLIADNGSVSLEEGYYLYCPTQAGICKIRAMVTTKSGKKAIDSFYYDVKRVPVFFDYGGYTSGFLPLKVLKNAHNIPRLSPDWNFIDEYNIQIDSLTISRFHENSLVFSKRVSGDIRVYGRMPSYKDSALNNGYQKMKNQHSFLDSEVSNDFNNAVAGDVILFDNILFKDFDGSLRVVKSKFYLLTDQISNNSLKYYNLHTLYPSENGQIILKKDK